MLMNKMGIKAWQHIVCLRIKLAKREKEARVAKECAEKRKKVIDEILKELE